MARTADEEVEFCTAPVSIHSVICVPGERLTGELADHHVAIHLSNAVNVVSHSPRRTTRCYGPGDVMIVPKGFRYAVSYKGSARVLLLNDVGLWLERAGSEIGCPRPFELQVVPKETDPQVEHLMRCLHAASRAGSSALYRDCVVQALAIHLVEHYVVFTRKARVYRRGIDEGTLRRLREYVDANLHAPIRLHDLSGQASLSAHYFCQLFKTSTGITPHRFVMQRRIERAKHLLNCTSCSLAEVSYATGFSSQAHFTQVFHAWVGMPPGAYRHQRSSGGEMFVSSTPGFSPECS